MPTPLRALRENVIAPIVPQSSNNANIVLEHFNSHRAASQTDVEVKIGGRIVTTAHRLVLSAFSSRFKCALMRVQNMATVTLEIDPTITDIKFEVLDELVNFCYTGQCRFSRKLLEAARYFGCEALIALLEKTQSLPDFEDLYSSQKLLVAEFHARSFLKALEQMKTDGEFIDLKITTAKDSKCCVRVHQLVMSAFSGEIEERLRRIAGQGLKTIDDLPWWMTIDDLKCVCDFIYSESFPRHLSWTRSKSIRYTANYMGVDGLGAKIDKTLLLVSQEEFHDFEMQVQRRLNLTKTEYELLKERKMGVITEAMEDLCRKERNMKEPENEELKEVDKRREEAIEVMKRELGDEKDKGRLKDEVIARLEKEKTEWMEERKKNEAEKKELKEVIKRREEDFEFMETELGAEKDEGRVKDEAIVQLQYEVERLKEFLERSENDPKEFDVLDLNSEGSGLADGANEEVPSCGNIYEYVFGEQSGAEEIMLANEEIQREGKQNVQLLQHSVDGLDQTATSLQQLQPVQPQPLDLKTRRKVESNESSGEMKATKRGYQVGRNDGMEKSGGKEKQKKRTDSVVVRSETKTDRAVRGITVDPANKRRRVMEDSSNSMDIVPIEEPNADFGGYSVEPQSAGGNEGSEYEEETDEDMPMTSVSAARGRPRKNDSNSANIPVIQEYANPPDPDRPFKCPYTSCIYWANARGSVQKHMRSSKHSNERPFVCSRWQCNYSSAFKHNLMDHERRHAQNEAGVKPWKCRYCGQRYSDWKNLRDHNCKVKVRSQVPARSA